MVQERWTEVTLTLQIPHTKGLTGPQFSSSRFSEKGNWLVLCTSHHQEFSCIFCGLSERCSMLSSRIQSFLALYFKAALLVCFYYGLLSSQDCSLACLLTFLFLFQLCATSLPHSLVSFYFNWIPSAMRIPLSLPLVEMEPFTGQGLSWVTQYLLFPFRLLLSNGQVGLLKY